MPPKIVTVSLGRLFSTGALGPIRIGAALFPGVTWPPLERLSYLVAGGAARLTRPWMVRNLDHPLRGVMRFVHLAEALVGIEGQWQVVDQNCAVRRVHRCPHAAVLGNTSQFCTRLGTALGQGLADVLVNNQTARFEVLSSLSQGHPCCEYRLWVE